MIIIDFYALFKRLLVLENQYIHLEKETASYYVEESGNTLYIYFEWSNGKTDWLNNFNFPARPYRDMNDIWFCHRGFLKVWKALEPHLKPHILKPNVENINVVGYSHGGAIAQLCYEYIKFNRPEVNVVGIGYGAPRVVWGKVSDTVKERFKDFVLVRNGNDLVTHLPPKFLGFRELGMTCPIGTAWSIHHFRLSVRKNGLFKAILNFDWCGPVKDHYPERYEQALFRRFLLYCSRGPH